MKLRLNIAEMETLMQSFYTMTGIRLVLFDTNGEAVLSYPQQDCNFCRLMKQCPNTRRSCRYADRRSFEKCKQDNTLVIYKCHAGLVEAVIPLHENTHTIGYLMFGQICDTENRAALTAKALERAAQYGWNTAAVEQAIQDITHKNAEQIRAAAKIMEACTSYIIYKELITPEGDRVVEQTKAYLEEHLGEDLDMAALCAAVQVGRTKLYTLFRKETKMGIAAYLLRRRLHRAKKLLKTTEMSIKEIAQTVGFSDYNYFSRVYKKQYGKSPRYYR